MMTAEVGEPTSGTGKSSTPPGGIEISLREEEIGQILPASTIADASNTDANKEAESSSPGRNTTADIPGSPYRIEMHEEPIHVEDTLATSAAGDRAMATNVAGGETMPPQPTHLDKHFLCKCFSTPVIIAFLVLIS